MEGRVVLFLSSDYKMDWACPGVNSFENAGHCIAFQLCACCSILTWLIQLSKSPVYYLTDDYSTKDGGCKPLNQHLFGLWGEVKLGNTGNRNQWQGSCGLAHTGCRLDGKFLVGIVPGVGQDGCGWQPGCLTAILMSCRGSADFSKHCKVYWLLQFSFILKLSLPKPWSWTT